MAVQCAAAEDPAAWIWVVSSHLLWQICCALQPDQVLWLDGRSRGRCHGHGHGRNPNATLTRSMRRSLGQSPVALHYDSYTTASHSPIPVLRNHTSSDQGCQETTLVPAFSQSPIQHRELVT
jgi:hypothetical protein